MKAGAHPALVDERLFRRSVHEDASRSGGTFVSRAWIAVLAAGAIVLAAIALYSLWAFWPSAEQPGASGAQGSAQRLNYFGWRPSLSREFLFFVVVAVAGALGGLVHTIRSFSWYVGNRQLHRSWMPFYLVPTACSSRRGHPRQEES